MRAPRPRSLAGLLTLAALAASLAACNSSAPTSSGGSTLPAGYDQFFNGVTVTTDNGYAVVHTSAVPDHKSPYFSTSDARYQAYNGSNPSFTVAPGTIRTLDLTFRLPLVPQKAGTAQSTPLGPIGVALNGVPFFNQYNGQRQALTAEINTFDQYNGHPTPGGDYHYHVEPLSLTAARGSSALVGFLLDGYPVYGPMENGARVTNAGLDSYHGHTGVTAEYPGGSYHYHVTDADPYLNGAGFYGMPGTVSQ